MPRIDTEQLVSWLRDKACRAPELSWTRMMTAAADRLDEQLMYIGGQMVNDYCWAQSIAELQEVLSRLNESGYDLVCVTVVGGGRFMVFFRRPAL